MCTSWPSRWWGIDIIKSHPYTSCYSRVTFTFKEVSVKIISLELSAFGWFGQSNLSLTCIGLVMMTSSRSLFDVSKNWTITSLLTLVLPWFNRSAIRAAFLCLLSLQTSVSFFSLKYAAAQTITWWWNQRNENNHIMSKASFFYAEIQNEIQVIPINWNVYHFKQLKREISHKSWRILVIQNQKQNCVGRIIYLACSRTCVDGATDLDFPFWNFFTMTHTYLFYGWFYFRCWKGKVVNFIIPLLSNTNLHIPINLTL